MAQTKHKQAEYALRAAGYTITFSHYKGKAYPHATFQGETKSHTASNMIKLCRQLLPEVELI